MIQKVSYALSLDKVFLEKNQESKRRSCDGHDQRSCFSYHKSDIINIIIWIKLKLWNQNMTEAAYSDFFSCSGRKKLGVTERLLMEKDGSINLLTLLIGQVTFKSMLFFKHIGLLLLVKIKPIY